jgi:curli biogenesis system outer membrane secretion channel CsgG
MNSQLRPSLLFLAISFLALIFLGCASFPELEKPQRQPDRETRLPESVPYVGIKKKIAVLDFDNQSGFGNEKFGSAVADMLITQLARSNRFVLIERSRIDQILSEQALGQSGTITETTAPQVAQLLGVESIIIGNVLKANQESGSHKFEDELDKWNLKLKATVGIAHISYKMIDAASGEILASDNFTATEIKPGFGFKSKDVDLEDMHEFDQTVLGKAVRKVIDKISLSVIKNASLVEWLGKVVQSQADTVIYFTPGRGAGVTLDQVFEIFEQPAFQNKEDFPDQDSISVDQPKARIIVTGFIGDKVARAKLLYGGGINRGDIVKTAKNLPDVIQ